MSQSDIIHLAADLSFLHTDYLWRMPGSWVGYDYYSTSEFYEDIARIAQRGVMDMLFFGDTGGTPEDYGGSYEAGVRYGAKWPRHDMAPMIPLMAKAASGVGFAITMSTTYHHPFYVARFFNALDHVTRGRIAWNAVTSAYKNEAANYGFDVMMDHDERYRRAQEFLEVACKLWDSVEKDALVADREKGIFATLPKCTGLIIADAISMCAVRCRHCHHRNSGRSSSRPVFPGPAWTSPPPTQTCNSAHAARSRACSNIARRWMQSLPKSAASPAMSGILWSIRIQVAESDAAAKEKERQYLESIRPEAGLVEMSAQYNVDFSKARPGMRLADFADEVRAQKGNYGSFEELLKTTRSVTDCRRVRPPIPGGPHSGGGRHAENHRRQTGRDACCIRRQRRIYPRPRLLSHGQHPRVCRIRRSRASTTRAVQKKIHGCDPAREP